MCQFTSMVLTRVKVYRVPGVDSHSHIIAINNLKHLDMPKKVDLVRVEFLPPEDYGTITDLSTWRFKRDQDILPEWYVEEHEETRVRQYAAENFRIITDDIDILAGYAEVVTGNIRAMIAHGSIGILYRGNVGVMRDSSKVGVMWDSSNVGEMWESSNVGVMRGSSKVGVMSDSSKVGEMRESSKVGVMRGSSKVGVMRDSSKVGNDLRKAEEEK